jgi:mRNA interferase RelE/StbE
LNWIIEFDTNIKKDFKKISKPDQKEIINYLEHKVLSTSNSREYGKPLKFRLKGLWRYKVKHYRIICQIKDHKMTILVVKIGHRKDVCEKINNPT